MLDRFLSGAADLPATIRTELDKLWSDLLPRSTRHLPKWEEQFGLRARALSEAERRDRLLGAWRATGGQSKYYIEQVVRDAGFDVRIYEWFIPLAQISGALAVRSNGVLALSDGSVLEARLDDLDFPARDPSATIRGTSGNTRCGAVGSRCGVAGPDGREVRILSLDGGAFTFDDGTIYSTTGYYAARCATFFSGGYMLVNRGLDAPTYPSPPSVEDDWAYVLYVSGDEIDTPAQIPIERRDDLEALLLELCPTQHWIGMIVEYL